MLMVSVMSQDEALSELLRAARGLAVLPAASPKSQGERSSTGPKPTGPRSQVEKAAAVGALDPLLSPVRSVSTSRGAAAALVGGLSPMSQPLMFHAVSSHSPSLAGYARGGFAPYAAAGPATSTFLPPSAALHHQGSNQSQRAAGAAAVAGAWGQEHAATAGATAATTAAATATTPRAASTLVPWPAVESSPSPRHFPTGQTRPNKADGGSGSARVRPLSTDRGATAATAVARRRPSTERGSTAVKPAATAVITRPLSNGRGATAFTEPAKAIALITRPLSTGRGASAAQPAAKAIISRPLSTGRGATAAKPAATATRPQGCGGGSGGPETAELRD